MKLKHKLKLKRAYDAPSDDDGYRILVDRLWPRGVTKIAAHIDLWAKEAAPSPELRKWFNHEPEKWSQFRDAYLDELARIPEKTTELKSHLHKGVCTLVYAAKDEAHNHALVLLEFLKAEITS